MAENEIDIPAPVEDVWEVLLDPYAYVRWVVGGRTVRAVDEDWPRPGTAFHHTAGVRPLVVKDKTKVLELEPHRRLVLEAKARPVGTARVVLELEATDDGTRVTLVEEPVSGPLTLVPDGVIDALTRARNAQSLRRLRALVEERRGAPQQS